MKKLTLIIAAIILLFSCRGFKYKQPQLIFEDNFDQKTLNTKYWSVIQKKNTHSKTKFVEITKNKTLKIYTTRKKDNKNNYLFGLLSTKGKFNIKYGKIEIRAKMNSSIGIWPAFWLKSNRFKNKSKINIAEQLYSDKTIYQRVHIPNFKEKEFFTFREIRQKRYTKNKVPTEKWNIYGIKWNPLEIIFTINGKRTLNYKKQHKHGPEQFPFLEDFHINLSMQIGGDWVEKNLKKNQNPITSSTVEIDWIRVWKGKKNY